MTTDSKKLAWITGGGSGIGKALALQLATLGWHVVISGRTESKLNAVAEHSPFIDAIVLDVTDKIQNKQVFDAICSNWACPDLVILNAGAYTPMPAEQFDLDLIHDLNAINYLGVMNGLAAALPEMQKRATGQILLVSSVVAYCGLPNAAPYGATKAALLNFAESLYLPLKKQGVLLRVVSPGFVSTPLTDQNDFTMPALISSEQAAQKIIKALDSTSFEITFPKRLSYVLKFLSMLPYRLYFSAIHKITGQ